jgi:hypothetical protein
VGVSPLFCVHLCSTWTLVGLIWVIQVVVYPQFFRLGAAEFADFHFAHCWRIGTLIAPLLLIEFGTAVWLLVQGRRDGLFELSVGLMVVNTMSTAVFQAPLHVRLMQGFDATTVRRLIATNWVRTLSWTLRGLLVGYLATN